MSSRRSRVSSATALPPSIRTAPSAPGRCRVLRGSGRSAARRRRTSTPVAAASAIEDARPPRRGAGVVRGRARCAPAIVTGIAVDRLHFVGVDPLVADDDARPASACGRDQFDGCRSRRRRSTPCSAAAARPATMPRASRPQPGGLRVRANVRAGPSRGRRRGGSRCSSSAIGRASAPAGDCFASDEWRHGHDGVASTDSARRRCHACGARSCWRRRLWIDAGLWTCSRQAASLGHGRVRRCAIGARST